MYWCVWVCVWLVFLMERKSSIAPPVHPNNWLIIKIMLFRLERIFNHIHVCVRACMCIVFCLLWLVRLFAISFSLFFPLYNIKYTRINRHLMVSLCKCQCELMNSTKNLSNHSHNSFNTHKLLVSNVPIKNYPIKTII